MTKADLKGDGILPAHLDFLAIFNPDLGHSEQTEKDQIVFYWSKPVKGKRKKKEQDDTDPVKEAESLENERMRQIGLAQGMVNFARTFGGGQNVDAVETERHRIVLKELEQGWWILASICLTRIPAHLTTGGASPGSKASPLFEYSTREVSPSVLLREQLLRAHRVFLLHHGRTLADVYAHLPRSRFCDILEKYWTAFAKRWDIMLHANPIKDVYAATKLAAAGELGIGVGEEDWGSAERGFLEGIIDGTDGLVDLIVLRSDAELTTRDGDRIKTPHPRQAYANSLAQGIVFSGCGNLSPHSVMTMSEWMQHVADHPSSAYGVQDSPSSTRKRLSRQSSSASQTLSQAQLIKSMKASQGHLSNVEEEQAQEQYRPAIPPSIMSVIESSLDKATTSAETSTTTAAQQSDTENASSQYSGKATYGDWSKYMKFGYGSSWGPAASSNVISQADHTPREPKQAQRIEKPRREQGKFMIGLTGSLSEDTDDAELPEHEEDGGSRISVRTVHVEQHNRVSTASETSTSGTYDGSTNADGARSFRGSRLRLLLYQDDPFLYAILLETTTSTLVMKSFYQTLHKQLQALHKPLDTVTAPQLVMERLVSTRPDRQDKTVLYDLLFETSNLTLRSTIPIVPEMPEHALDWIDQQGPWTRLEALNVHMQTLSIIAESRNSGGLRESSSRTQRDWWILWMQQQSMSNASELPKDPEDDSEEEPSTREAILIRKALVDVKASSQRRASSAARQTSLGSSPSSFGLGRFIGRSSVDDAAPSDGTSSSSSPKPNKIHESIGADPRKYVESLFNLNR